MRRLALLSLLLLGCRRGPDLSAKDQEIAALKRQVAQLELQLKLRRCDEPRPAALATAPGAAAEASKGGAAPASEAERRAAEQQQLKDRFLALTLQFRQAKTPEERESIRRKMLEERQRLDAAQRQRRP